MDVGLRVLIGAWLIVVTAVAFGQFIKLARYESALEEIWQAARARGETGMWAIDIVEKAID